MLAEFKIDSLIPWLVIGSIVYGFLKNLFTQMKESKEQQKAPPSKTLEEVMERRRKLEEFQKQARRIDDEAEARRRAWEQQVGLPQKQDASSELDSAQPKATPAVPSLQDAIRTWREAQELKQEASKPTPPPLPTPPPVVQRHEPVRGRQEASETSKKAWAESARTQQVTAQSLAAYESKGAHKKKSHPLAALLKDKKRYREAVLLKEILDQPVSMKFSSNSRDSS